MLTPEQSKQIEDILVKLVAKYPDWGQWCKAIEELGECTAALGKYFVNPTKENAENFVDEMCDVLLCFAGVLMVVKVKYRPSKSMKF